MSFKVRFHPEAQIDLTDALDWYENIDHKITIDFFRVISVSIDYIKSNPLGFTKRYKNVRILPLKKYPYLICYFIDETSEIINIIAIFNSYRNPLKWQKRVK
jgi:plasmid stabilization system protein ParE